MNGVIFKSNRLFLLALGVTGWLTLNGVLLSCGPEKRRAQAPLVEKCQLGSDQNGTLKGRWPGLPVFAAFHQGDFSQAEADTGYRAATTWNNFYNQTKGSSLLELTDSQGSYNESNQEHPRSLDALCATEIVSGGVFNRPVVIYKMTNNWPYQQPTSGGGDQSGGDVIALTVYCDRFVGNETLPRKHNAIMDFNYVHFFSGDNKKPDLESIFLHEFGHLFGLGHSCEVGGGEGVPNCSTLPETHDYVQAALFPIILFQGNNGVQRRSLNANDQGRMNCLY